MPKLRNLSGNEIIQILSESGFTVESQRGSHAKLRRVLSNGTRQTLTIPIHEELDKGTLRAIFRQALKYLPEEQLRSYFYSK
jgi:predicted RNA binding protein YcfA (HicA-like mRNA interferase family)